MKVVEISHLYSEFIKTEYIGDISTSSRKNPPFFKEMSNIHSFSDRFMKYFYESRNPAITEESEITPLTRSYVLDPHETKPVRIWNDLNLVEYSWNNEKEEIELRLVKIEQ